MTVSQLVTEPAHSIMHQSYRARERAEPLNGDGFGVAWYRPEISPHPAVFKEVQPAWSSLNLAAIAPVAESACILAHVRAASSGLSVSQLNCHPFSSGRFAFMHNGELGGFLGLRRQLLAALSDQAFQSVQGTTDSELVFALMRDRLSNPSPSLMQMAMAVSKTIAMLEKTAASQKVMEATFLNLVLTDGQRAIVTRYATVGGGEAQSLYLHQGARYRCVDGVCQMHADGDRACLVVASEPLSTDDGWSRVEPNTMLLIDADLQLAVRPLKTTRKLSS